MTAEARDQFLSKIQATPAPTRAAARKRQGLWLGGTLLAGMAIWFVLTRISPHADGRPGWLRLETSLGSTAIAALAVWVILGGRSMLGRSSRILLAAMLLTPLALFAWKWGSATIAGFLDPYVRTGWRCLGISLAVAISPLVALLLLRRGSDPVHPMATGAALGVATGAGSWVLVDLWCPLSLSWHLLFGHVLPMAILAALGALLGRALVGWERETIRLDS